jgi:hypothetical protein
MQRRKLLKIVEETINGKMDPTYKTEKVMKNLSSIDEKNNTQAPIVLFIICRLC